MSTRKQRRRREIAIMQTTPANLNDAGVVDFFAARKQPDAMLLEIGKKKFAVADLAEASAIYQMVRNRSGAGASRFPEGKVGDYRISYNGRVWLGEWKQGQKPVMEATAL